MRVGHAARHACATEQLENPSAALVPLIPIARRILGQVVGTVGRSLLGMLCDPCADPLRVVVLGTLLGTVLPVRIAPPIDRELASAMAAISRLGDDPWGAVGAGN